MSARVASSCGHALQCPVCKRIWQHGLSPIHRVWCAPCLQSAVARARRRARRARIRAWMQGAFGRLPAELMPPSPVTWRETVSMALAALVALLILTGALVSQGGLEDSHYGTDSSFPIPAEPGLR